MESRENAHFKGQEILLILQSDYYYFQHKNVHIVK